jgi:prophage regulatory protein
MRVYRFPDLRCAGVGFCRKHIRTLERRGEFPRHFNLGESTVAWVADEVDAWVDERVRDRRQMPRRGWTAGDRRAAELVASASDA